MKELYFSCHAPTATSPEAAIRQLRENVLRALAEKAFCPSDMVFMRLFCSDVYTHARLLPSIWPDTTPCQRVLIGQTPLDSAYISLQAYCIRDAQKRLEQDGSLLVQHGAYRSLWTLDHPPAPSDSCSQSDAVIAALRDKLRRHGMTLRDHVIRTWYYVRDVDNNYAGMIKSRVSQYEACGLGPQTHFIASTGIEACAPQPHTLVWLHGYAQLGLQPEQITYLKATDHLSPTHVYGVNFERGTRILYGDRMHGRISGTASIDHEGHVLHKGDVVRQFERAVENVAALLHEGAMSLQHLQAATIYLRDSHDCPRIAPLVKSLLPANCAVNITHGPVCRPDWLVEIEGEAIAPCQSAFPPFL
ncbi:MAG TPA: hypothetical protein H9784_11215 [Candidatus Desulfovibrio intestinavium]|uniref:Translation initiation inhibitor n=1 Tax=Candidatus Desulfovibrio intestinavium TaxID=2838534 RepID=A0A9D2KSQ4_9BACT|nr:hypothetical protein [Candidatus Desulfovibrio intestinavium]